MQGLDFSLFCLILLFGGFFMSMFYSLEDVRGDEFYQLPKDLVKNEKYKNLSANAKIAYAILKDRHQISLKNAWIDEKGVYFLLSDNELANILDTSVRSASRYKNDLQNYELIHMERQGLNRRNKIYLLKPETTLPYTKEVKPLSLADRTILSSPDKTKLSNQDRTILSSQDKTELSMYSNNDFSNNDFSNKEEEEEATAHLNNLKFLFSNTSISLNKTIENKLADWLKVLPYEVLKAEIENSALYGAKSWNYIERLLLEDKDKNIHTAEAVEQKNLSYKSNKSKKNSGIKKAIRKEYIPDWLNEHEQQPKNDINETIDRTEMKQQIAEKLKAMRTAANK
jgi:hypothetical protein